MNVRIAATLFLMLCGIWSYSKATADVVLTSEFFQDTNGNGRIQAFDAVTKAETNFATIAGNPGFSGLAYSQSTNTVYASALNHGGVYRFNAQTGALLGFSSLGIGPGGLAVSSIGNVYVTDFTSNNLRIYDSTFSSPPTIIAVPNATSLTSGVGFLNNGDAVIATPGGGTFRYNGSTVSAFSTDPSAVAASAQVATDALGNTFIGHGTGFADSVLRFNANGDLLGAITITPAMINSTGNGSSTGTSPGGVTFDTSGNLFIAVLGQSNPGDVGGERGGLFKFDVNGNLLDTFAVGSRAYSSAVFVAAVPEPGSLVLLGMGAVAAVFVRRRRSTKFATV